MTEPFWGKGRLNKYSIYQEISSYSDARCLIYKNKDPACCERVWKVAKHLFLAFDNVYSVMLSREMKLRIWRTLVENHFLCQVKVSSGECACFSGIWVMFEGY